MDASLQRRTSCFSRGSALLFDRAFVCPVIEGGTDALFGFRLLQEERNGFLKKGML